MFTNTSTQYSHIDFAILLALLVLFTLASTQAEAGTDESRTVKYSIEIDGYDTGNSKSQWTRTSAATRLDTQEDIDAFGYKYTLRSDYVWEQGQLTSFAVAENDDGIEARVSGRVEGEQMEIFQDKSKESFHTLKTTDYDTSYEGLPQYLAHKKFPQNTLKVRVLEAATGEVVPCEISIQGDVKLQYAGASFDCKNVRYSAAGTESTLWIAEDKLGPFLVKGIIKSELGTIVQELKSYSLKNTQAQ